VNFQPELARKVMAGEKTVTRRLASDNPRSPWWRERTWYQPGNVFTVNPGRGKMNIGRARVKSARLIRLGVPGLDEARREGFATMAGFRQAFAAINGRYHQDAKVWRIEFEVVATASGEVLVDPRDAQLEPDAGTQARGEGVVEHDALALELGQDLVVGGHGAASDVSEARRAAVLEVDAPPVAVGIGPGCLSGVGDPGDLHGGSVRATRTERVGVAGRCELLHTAAHRRGQSDDGEAE
jgi:hypothetical protein